MKARLLASLAGGVGGVAVASPINSSLGLSPTIAYIACTAIGLALGYGVSIFFDVFTASPGDENAES
ncbi:MAG TPA: hypothetical protein VEV17_19680 [Bryobacteraceae bacterium]|nr:hypothetical protein [Bryobacteraceae bacterium]